MTYSEKEKDNRKLKVIRFSFWVLLFSCIVVIALFIFVHFFLTPFVKNKIISTIHETSGGLYILEFDHFELKFWKGAVHMSDVYLKQDTSVLNKLRRQDPSSNLSNINIRILDLSVSSIRWQNYLFNRSLEVGRVLIENPDFYFSGNVPKDTLKISRQSFIDALPGIIAGFAGSLKIQELTVKDGRLQYLLKSQTGTNQQKAENINIHLENIKIDTISPRKVLYTDHVHFSLKNYQLLTEDSLYLFSIQRMEGSYSDSLLKIDSIQFIPINSKSVKNDTYSLFIKQIKSEIIDFPLFFKEQKVSIGKMKMDNPKFSIKYTYIKRDTSTIRKNLIAVALPYIGNSFSIKTFSVINGEINSTLSASGELIKQKASNIYLDLKEVKIDSSNFNHGHYWKDLNLQLSNYEGMLHSKNLKINIQRLETPSSSELNLTSVKISEMHPAGKKQQLIFENSIKDISLNNIDFHRLFRHQDLVVRNVQVNAMHLHVFRDQTIPPKQSYAARMPNELVRELPLYFKISSLKFNNAHITYSDHSPELKEDAKLTFEKTEIEVSNFTNDPRIMNKKYPAIIKVRTYVMGQGLLSVNILIPLLDKQFNCDLEGTLGKMDATYFNSFIAYGGLQLKEGNIEAQRFNINVANGIANGEMQLIYQNLHVNVIEKKSGKPKKILSKIANLFLKDDNKQKKNKGPEAVKINYIRQSNDGFFSFMWNSLSDAILETVVKEFFQPFVKEN